MSEFTEVQLSQCAALRQASNHFMMCFESAWMLAGYIQVFDLPLINTCTAQVDSDRQCLPNLYWHDAHAYESIRNDSFTRFKTLQNICCWHSKSYAAHQPRRHASSAMKVID